MRIKFHYLTFDLPVRWKIQIGGQKGSVCPNIKQSVSKLDMSLYKA